MALLSFWAVVASSGGGVEQLAAPSVKPMAHAERETSRKPMKPLLERSIMDGLAAGSRDALGPPDKLDRDRMKII
jgi:hypothetical protein